MSQRESIEAYEGSYAREIVSNVVIASFFLLFAVSCGKGFVSAPRFSTFLILTKESLDAFFFLCRRLPKQVTTRFASWMTAIGGSLAPLLLRPAATTDLLVGNVLQTVGILLQIVAIISLNRSFGVVPANPGIKRNGMYRLVRHPLYASYTIAIAGFVINNLNLLNFTLFVIATGFAIVRIHREEEFLSEDCDYQAYTQETRWRMVPFLF